MIHLLNAKDSEGLIITLIAVGIILIVLIFILILVIAAKKGNNDKNIQKDSNNPIPNPLQTTDLTPQNIETSTSPNVKYREISAEPEKKSNFGTGLAIFLLIIILAVAGFFIFKSCASQNQSGNPSSNKSDTPALLHRNARLSDLNIEQSNEISLSNNYIITPNVDIAGLEITFRFCDENGETISNKVKVVGNVSEGVEYKVSISLSEFTLSEIFKIQTVYYTVSGGSVSYFA